MDNNMCDSIKFNLIQYHLSSNAQIDSLIQQDKIPARSFQFNYYILTGIFTSL